MKFFTILAIVLAWSQLTFAQNSETYNYSNLPAEAFDKLENNSQFVDKTTNETYKITNTEYQKGLSVQITENGRTRFVKHGVFYSFYKGKKSELKAYEYGIREGIQESYNSEGITKFQHMYKKGRKDGISKQWNDKGELVRKSMYADGLKNGTDEQYYNGKLNFKIEYKDGKKHGSYLQYNRNGEVVSRKTYSNGKVVK